MQFEPPRPNMPPTPVQPTGFFTGVQIFPVIVGVVVDYIATYVVMYGYLFLYLAPELSKKGEVTEDTLLRYLTQYMTSPEGLAVAFVIGTACTALGGFVAARRAGSFEIKHGAFVGLGSLIVAFIEQASQQEAVPIPEWFRLLSVAAIIPAGALGGFVAEIFKRFRDNYGPGRAI